MVEFTGSLLLRGTIVWFTPDQGGRVSGPPMPDYDYDYTATAYVPPRTADNLQAGIALSRFAPGAWRSPAEGLLAASPDARAQHISPGSIVVITEGTRPVGLFTIAEVDQIAAVVPLTTAALPA